MQEIIFNICFYRLIYFGCNFFVTLDKTYMFCGMSGKVKHNQFAVIMPDRSFHLTSLSPILMVMLMLMLDVFGYRYLSWKSSFYQFPNPDLIVPIQRMYDSSIKQFRHLDELDTSQHMYLVTHEMYPQFYPFYNLLCCNVYMANDISEASAFAEKRQNWVCNPSL